MSKKPLAKEIGLEAAGTAIGADRRLVGELQRHVDIDIRHAIGTRHELRDIARADRAVGAHIGADVHIGMAAQAEDRAVARAGDLDVALRLARVIERHQLLAAILGPFHRAPGVARRERNEKVLGIELAARAEAAADVVLHHVDRVLGEAHLLREHAAVEEQHLGAAVDGELSTRGVPLRQQPARLHRQRHVPLHAEALAPDVRRVPERGGGVAEQRMELDCEVGAFVLEQQRSVAQMTCDGR